MPSPLRSLRSKRLEGGGDNRARAGVAELVDARDLKSLGAKALCRFDSGRPHHHFIFIPPMPPPGAIFIPPIPLSGAIAPRLAAALNPISVLPAFSKPSVA